MKKLLSLTTSFFFFTFLFFFVNTGSAYAINDAVCNAVAIPMDQEHFEVEIPGLTVVGQAYSVAVSFKNTGDTTWTPWDGVTPGAFGAYRVAILEYPTWTNGRLDFWPYTVAPDQTMVANGIVIAPATIGNPTFTVKMVREGYEFFGQQCGGTADVRAIPTGSMTYVPNPGQTSVTMNLGDTLPAGALRAAFNANQPGKLINQAMVIVKKSPYDIYPDNGSYGSIGYSEGVYNFTWGCGNDELLPNGSTTNERKKIIQRDVIPPPPLQSPLTPNITQTGRYCFQNYNNPYNDQSFDPPTGSRTSGNFTNWEFTPTEPGTYYVIADTIGEYGIKCTGAPWPIPFGHGFWDGTLSFVKQFDCGPNDLITIVVNPNAELKAGAGSGAISSTHVPIGVGRTIPQGGSNVDNPLRIEQRIRNDNNVTLTGANKKTIYFYNASAGQKNSVAEVKTYLNTYVGSNGKHSGGFILTYDQKGTEVTSDDTYSMYNPCTQTDVPPFTTSPLPTFNQLFDCSGITLVRVTSHSLDLVTWEVTFDASFESKNLLSGSEVEVKTIKAVEALTPSPL